MKKGLENRRNEVKLHPLCALKHYMTQANPAQNCKTRFRDPVAIVVRDTVTCRTPEQCQSSREHFQRLLSTVRGRDSMKHSAL